MTENSPYASPTSNLEDNKNDDIKKIIDSLDISEKWKEKFHAIAAVGGPKMPHMKTAPKDIRSKAFSFNILAFLFGPFYYIYKGMWKRGIFMFLVLFAIVFAVAVVMEMYGYGQYAKSLKYGVSAIFAIRANIDYYKKMVLKDNGWI